MKLAIVILAMVGVAMACDSKRAKEEFESFRRRYRKAYKDTAEENYRCSVFADNLAKVEGHNLRQARGLESYTLDINEFSDYTQQEFIATHTGLRPDFESDNVKTISYKPRVLEYNPEIKAPTSIDWRALGFVTPIRNQGQCGSCWAFTTAGVMEMRALIHHNKPHYNHDISEQHYIECSSAYGNQKCNGGLMENTYKYMLGEKHGSQPEIYYPYVSANGNNGTQCKYHQPHSEISITGYTVVAKDDAALEQAVANGPVAVGVNADTWQNYATGIFNPKGIFGSGCGSILLNHAVIVVGYTPDYWIVKNSWGTSWGEDGYIRLGRTYKNMCGINKMASFPHAI